MVLMNLFAGQQWRRRHKEDLWTLEGSEREGQIDRVTVKQIHYHM